MAGVGYFAAWFVPKQIALNLKQLKEGWWNFKEAAPLVCRAQGSRSGSCRGQGRPYRHLSRTERMEDKARELARQDGITDGLVCAYGAMETCRTFRVRYSDNGPKVRSDQRVCLVIYFYWMDREIGLMHVKLQTGFHSRCRYTSTATNGSPASSPHVGLTSRKSTTRSSNWQMSIGPAACAESFGGAIGLSCSIAWRPRQSVIEGLVSRPKLLLGDRSGRVLH